MIRSYTGRSPAFTSSVRLSAAGSIRAGSRVTAQTKRIFALACEKLGPHAADGSGIINVAIAGGAVIPALYGLIADASGSLAFALALPATCYAVIAGFGVFARKPA